MDPILNKKPSYPANMYLVPATTDAGLSNDASVSISNVGTG
jgi:hypothetical protein